jgi:YHS domain-containing protein
MVRKIITMKTIALLLLLLLACTPQLTAQHDVRKNQFNLKKDVALEGYDPVSYFDGKPKEGDDAIRTVYKSVIYQFANQQNLARFKASPDKYEPVYGGWCAYAMGETGEKVKIDPETFKIIDGRLYLFYNFWGNNTLEDWNLQEKKLKESADRNWHKFVQ